MKKIAVLASGSGSNLQSLIDNIHNKEGIICAVISDRKGAYALERAKTAGIPAIHISRLKYENDEQFNNEILSVLKTHGAEGVVLAGYLKILTEKFIDTYKNKIINIHPSLIPSFCGDGFYGMRVHNAVYEKGVKITGATVHFVDHGVDSGPIIMQKAVEINQNDLHEDIQKKVLEIEHKILVQSVRYFLYDKIDVINNRVYIKE
ncbi:MAG: phosphoribosylglycinamide formyltransferase [Eubacteriaceae bacterium]|nr:phosphoribosylglycinamide formyltransferase [Eubacteriaceae bacterium]